MTERAANLGIIGRDIPWERVKASGWLMTTMMPQARVDEHGRIRDAGWFQPYAMLHLRTQEGEAFLEVTHKVDFRHIWEAWQKQRSGAGEVVACGWPRMGPGSSDRVPSPHGILREGVLP